MASRLVAAAWVRVDPSQLSGLSGPRPAARGQDGSPTAMPTCDPHGEGGVNWVPSCADPVRAWLHPCLLNS